MDFRFEIGLLVFAEAQSFLVLHHNVGRKEVLADGVGVRLLSVGRSRDQQK
jgi:hypothetical protein